MIFFLSNCKNAESFYLVLKLKVIKGFDTCYYSCVASFSPLKSNADSGQLGKTAVFKIYWARCAIS